MAQQVTFYAPGCTRCGAVGSATGAYVGPLYDGERKLVKMFGPNKYITFTLEPGTHTFSGSGTWSNKRSNEGRLQVELEASRAYVIRLQNRRTGLGVIRKLTPVFSLADCHDAVAEGAKMEPVKAKEIAVELTMVIPSIHFPQCLK